MATVQAVKSEDDIKTIYDFLLKNYNAHYADMWSLSVNIAPRVGDMLNLTMDKVRESLDTGMLVLRESKTGYKKCKETGQRIQTKKKPRVIKLNKKAKSVLETRLDEYVTFYYLFQSEAKNVKKIQPMSRQGYGNALREAGRKVGINAGTHSGRKSRGALLYRNGVPIETICLMLNHSSPEVTMRYIGITQDDVNSTYDEYEF